MNEKEIVTEIEYILERGVPVNVQIILYTLVGAIQSGDTATLAIMAQQYAMVRKIQLGG